MKVYGTSNNNEWFIWIGYEYSNSYMRKIKFHIKRMINKNLLSSIHAHPKQRNIYGYLTEISSFKGIFSIMRELIENDENFRNF